MAKIKAFGRDGDAAVLSTINGDSNVAFYREFARQGLTPRTIPVMPFSVAEDELRSMEGANLVGHLATWNDYQSIDTPENARFVPTNHHAYKPVYVGRVRADGQFDVVWRSDGLVEPQAFSPYLKAARSH